MTFKTFTTLALLSTTYGCAQADKSGNSDDTGAPAFEQATEPIDNPIEPANSFHEPSGSDGSGSSDDTDPARTDEPTGPIDGAVVLEDGSERPLVSGIAYVDEFLGQENLVIMLSSYELNGCDVEWAWWDRPGTDWAVIELEFDADLTELEIMMKAPDLTADGERDGAWGAEPNSSNGEIDLLSLADLVDGQEITGSMWADGVDLNDGKVVPLDNPPVAADADFTVEFCSDVSW